MGSSLPAILSCVRLLPPGHKLVLKALICFLAKVAQNSDKNCMSDKNIATCFAPAVVRRKDTPSDMSAFLAESRKGETLFQIFINNYHALFVCIPSSLSTFLFPSPYFLGFLLFIIVFCFTSSIHPLPLSPSCLFIRLFHFFFIENANLLSFHAFPLFRLLPLLSLFPFTFVIVSKFFCLCFSSHLRPFCFPLFYLSPHLHSFSFPFALLGRQPFSSL